MPKPRVVIVQKWIPHYRVGLFNQLRARLDTLGVHLDVVYGTPPAEVPAYDGADLPWGRRVRLTEVRLGRSTRAYWQAALQPTAGAHLVIVEQANGALVNVPLLALQALGRREVAFWGHGRNFEAKRSGSVREAVKRQVARLPSWWFAYTEMTRAVLLDAGYPADRITVLDNAVDTAALRREVFAVTANEVEVLRKDRRLGAGPVGLFLGTLYAEKQLDVLIAGADVVRRAVPEFQLVVAGDGPDRHVVEEAARRRLWMHVWGPVIGPEKAQLLRAADVVLMPGRVGLVVLDAFAADLPVVTRADANHAPEFAYVAHGENSLVVRDGAAEAFGAAVTEVLSDSALRSRLVAGAGACSSRYTLEHMVDRFSAGIVSAVHRR